MLKQFIVALGFGFILSVSMLSAQDGNAGLVPQEEAQSATVSPVTQEAADITAKLTAREAEVAGNQKQSDGIRALLKLLTAGMETQQRMLAALPSELRVQVEHFFAQHKEFVARIHAPHAITTLGLELQKLLGDCVVEGESPLISNLRRHLHEGIQGLYGGHWGEMFDVMTKKQQTDVREMLGDVFAGTVIGGGSMMPGVKARNDESEEDEEELYDIDNLRCLAEALVSAQEDFKKCYPTCTAFDHFNRYVQAVANENIHAMAQAAFMYLEPMYLSVTKELFDIQVTLYELFMSSMKGKTAVPAEVAVVDNKPQIEATLASIDALLNQEDGQTLYSSNPYYYWLSTLKRHEGSCTSYAFIKKRFKQEGIGKEYFQLFRLFAHAYTFSHHCLDIYHEEAEGVGGYGSWDTKRLVPTLLNYAFTSTVAANYFFNVQKIARNNICYDVFTQKGAIADMRTQMRALVADYIGIAAAAPVLYGSPLYGRRIQTHLGEEVEKFAASWVYYQIFYSNFFNRNAFLKPDGKSDTGSWSLWPAEFGPFQKGLLSTIDESARFMCRIAEATCYNKMNPDLMEDIETATLGIVNPGAIRYVAKAFLPMMLLSDFGAILGLPSGAIEDHYALLSPFVKDQAGNERPNPRLKGMSPEGYFAERELYRYACRSVGYTAGYWVSGYIHEELFDAAGSALNGLLSLGDKIGLGLGDSHEMVGIFKHAAPNAVEMMIDTVKLVLWPSAELEQAMKPFLRGFLLESGYLDFDHDENAYREAVVNMTLTQLAIRGFVSHYDAAVYARSFKREPTMVKVDEICRRIGKSLKKQLVCMGAGKATEWLTEKLGDVAYKGFTWDGKVLGYHLLGENADGEKRSIKLKGAGPFTPKVRALFTSDDKVTKA